MPPAQLRSPSGDVLSPDSMRIRLVGKEKDGALLISRLSYDPVRVACCRYGELRSHHSVIYLLSALGRWLAQDVHRLVRCPDQGAKESLHA